jgi:plasmid stability protein
MIMARHTQEADMPTLTISDDVAERLAQRAASHGRTAEAEARDIIAKELDRPASAARHPDNLFDVNLDISSLIQTNASVPTKIGPR